MFDISEKLIVGRSDEIYGMTPINWEDSSWKIIFGQWWRSHHSLAREGLRIFRFGVMPWKVQFRTHNQKLSGKISWRGSRVHHNTEFWTIEGEQMEVEWNISQDSPHCSSATKSKSSCQKMRVEPEDFTGRIIFMSMFNDILWVSQEKSARMRIKRSIRFDLCKKLPSRTLVTCRTWIRKEVVFHFFWQTTTRMGQSRQIDDDKNLEKADTQFPNPRIHHPEVLKSKGGGKLPMHFCADGGTIETVFRTNISVNQLSIYGAVSDLCEECKSCHVRTENLYWQDNLDPLFEPASLLMTTPTLSTEVLAQEVFLQRYKERVERLSQQNRVIKMCIDAGFPTTVDVGQYFMTKDTE